MLDQKTIDAAARVLLSNAPEGSRVILFGSWASGDARPGSDLDFLVIEPSVQDKLLEIFRLRKAVQPVFGRHVQPVDLIVMDEARFQQAKDVPNTLAFEAATTGRLYA